MLFPAIGTLATRDRVNRADERSDFACNGRCTASKIDRG